MPPSVTPGPRSWVTAIAQPIRRLFARPPLSDRALWVLDLATRANCSVYEDEDSYSWAVDERGHVHDVEREVNQLRAHGRGCLTAGDWSPIGKPGGSRRWTRRWAATVQGRLALIKAGRRPWPCSASAASRALPDGAAR